MAEQYRYIPMADKVPPHRDLPQRVTFTDGEWKKETERIKSEVQQAIASRPNDVPIVAYGDMSDDYEIARISADLGVAAKIDLGAEAAHVSAINEKAAQAKADQAEIRSIKDQLTLIAGGKKEASPVKPIPQKDLIDGAAS